MYSGSKVQGALPNMVIYSKIVRKSEKNQKKWGMILIVADDVW
jgi:hypothetical protein